MSKTVEHPLDTSSLVKDIEALVKVFSFELERILVRLCPHKGDDRSETLPPSTLIDQAEIHMLEASRIQRRLELKSVKAAEILLHLAAKPGQVQSYDALQSLIGTASGRRVIHVYVCDLRVQLARFGLQNALQTKRGAGYRLDPKLAEAVRALWQRASR